MNDGLIDCLNDYHICTSYIMQKLIDKGANSSVMLPHIFKKIIENVGNLTSDRTIIQKFNFLCNQGAYDQTVFDKVQNLQAIFGDLTNNLEKNKVLES